MQRSMAIVLAVAVTSSAGLAMASVTAKDAASTNYAVSTHTSAQDMKIDQELGVVAKEALMTKNMPGLVAQFDQQSQERIRASNDYAKNYGRELDGQIEQLSHNWQKKYGRALMVNSSGNVFGSMFATVDVGAPRKDARLASEVEKDGGLPSRDVTSDDAIAVANVRGTRNLVAIEAPLVCENAGHWRLAAPASLTADELRQNLLTQFRAINREEASWPANEMDAQRMVAHHVMEAIFNGARSASNSVTAKPSVAAAKPLPAQTAKPAPVSTSSGTNNRWWQFWRW